MSANWLSKNILKRSVRSKLAVAVTAGLMAGVYAPVVWAATDYTAPLTGTLADANFLGDGIVSASGNTITYNFTGDKSFATSSSGAEINLANGQKVIIDNVGNTLSFEANAYGGAGGFVVGIADDRNANITINSNLNLSAHSDGYSAQGLALTKVGDQGGTAKLLVNGDVLMRNSSDDDNPWAVTAKNIHGGYSDYTGSRWSPIGIALTAGHGSELTINGNVDLAVKGTAVQTDPFYEDNLLNDYHLSVINLNGGNVTIDTPQSQKEAYYALANYGGTINVNMSGNVAGNNNVDIDGNIIVMKENNGSGGEYYYRDGQINMALATKDSQWSGVIDNTGTKQAGEVNLYLQNKATWNHQAMSMTDGVSATNCPSPSNSQYGHYYATSFVNNFVGGQDEASSGNIMQRDKANIQIANYSGYTDVYYEHSGDGTKASDYAAGNIIIDKAQEGSAISMITSVSNITNDVNIDTTDDTQVYKVFDALAGKLSYTNYVNAKENLDAKVKIASGLINSSVERTGVIKFNDAGIGSYDDKYETGGQLDNNFNNGITGDASNDQNFTDNNVRDEEEGKVVYKFTKDSTIETSDGTAPITMKDGMLVDATGNKLTLVNKYEDPSVVYGITQTTTGKSEVNAKELVVVVENTNSARNDARAIYVHNEDKENKSTLTINADMVDVTAKANRYTIGVSASGNAVVNINGDIKANVDGNGKSGWVNEVSGIYSGSHITTRVGAEVNVSNNVYITSAGNGLYANGAGSTINIDGGGTIEVTKLDTVGFSAIRAEDAIVNMNLLKDDSETIIGAGENDVNIKGNLVLDTSMVGTHDPNGTLAQINLGLGTKESTLQGVIHNAYTDGGIKKGDLVFTGEANLWLQNGATWINEQYGVINDAMAPQKFVGSKVTNFAGGTSEATAGNIFQKDNRDLTIKNYSGFTNIYYERGEDGSYSALGNTIIENAEAGSQVTMITDSVGIDKKDQAWREETFSALANKLYYMAAAKPIQPDEEGIQTLALTEEGEEATAQNNNLTGKLQIASGLIDSAVAYKADMTFDENGQGQYVIGSMSDALIYGAYENGLMKGARSAMTSAALNWRNIASDIDGINTDDRKIKDKEVWAKTYGGKTEYDGAGLDVSSSYWAAQVGYDRNYGSGWNAGIAIDYLDGSSDYQMGGEGDDTMYAVGIYGSKDFGDKGYLDIAAKFGKIENEYTVHDEYGQSLEGDYDSRAYSISAQYGKRFGDAKGGYWEPQAQLTWARVKGGNFTADGGSLGTMHIDQDAFNSLVGRIGVKAGKENDRGGYYAKLSLAHEFAGDIEARYSDGYNSKKTSYDLGDTWSELSLGANYKLSECSNFYADITRSLSGDYQHEWKLNAGFNFSF